MFKIGQNVVHKSHGIGTITGIEIRQFNTEKSDYYILEIQDNGAPKKVFVQTSDANAKIRPLISSTKAKYILEYITANKPERIDHQTWNMRYRQYMEMIHSGEVTEVAKVYLALKQLKDDKNLSFGERKLFDQARQLLITELKLVLSIGEIL